MSNPSQISSTPSRTTDTKTSEEQPVENSTFKPYPSISITAPTNESEVQRPAEQNGIINGKSRVSEEEEAKRKADETAKRLALEKEAAQQEAARRETARKEAAEAEARDIERRKNEEKEAEAREVAKREIEQRQAEERAAAERERARREVEELKAAQLEISRIQAADQNAKERESKRRESVLHDIAKRKAALYDEDDASTERDKARRKSDQDTSAVEELLRLERTRPSSPPRNKPSASTESLINEDELLFSAARMAANTLANGKRLWSEVPDFSQSTSAASTPPIDRIRRSTLSSSTPKDKGKNTASHMSVNGYDVALPPSPLGLGRTLSRSEQRIRQTGAKGLASIPLPPLTNLSSSEKTRKVKRTKRDK